MFKVLFISNFICIVSFLVSFITLATIFNILITLYLIYYFYIKFVIKLYYGFVFLTLLKTDVAIHALATMVAWYCVIDELLIEPFILPYYTLYVIAPVTLLIGAIVTFFYFVVKEIGFQTKREYFKRQEHPYALVKTNQELKRKIKGFIFYNNLYEELYPIKLYRYLGGLNKLLDNKLNEYNYLYTYYVSNTNISFGVLFTGRKVCKKNNVSIMSVETNERVYKAATVESNIKSIFDKKYRNKLGLVTNIISLFERKNKIEIQRNRKELKILPLQKNIPVGKSSLFSFTEEQFYLTTIFKGKMRFQDVTRKKKFINVFYPGYKLMERVQKPRKPKGRVIKMLSRRTFVGSENMLAFRKFKGFPTTLHWIDNMFRTRNLRRVFFPMKPISPIKAINRVFKINNLSLYGNLSMKKELKFKKKKLLYFLPEVNKDLERIWPKRGPLKRLLGWFTYPYSKKESKLIKDYIPRHLKELLFTPYSKSNYALVKKNNFVSYNEYSHFLKHYYCTQQAHGYSVAASDFIKKYPKNRKLINWVRVFSNKEVFVKKVNKVEKEMAPVLLKEICENIIPQHNGFESLENSFIQTEDAKYVAFSVSFLLSFVMYYMFYENIKKKIVKKYEEFFYYGSTK